MFHAFDGFSLFGFQWALQRVLPWVSSFGAAPSLVTVHRLLVVLFLQTSFHNICYFCYLGFLVHILDRQLGFETGFLSLAFGLKVVIYASLGHLGLTQHDVKVYSFLLV